MKVIYPARKRQSWNSNPDFSDPEDCMHGHHTVSLSAMHMPICSMPRFVPNAHHQLSFPSVCLMPICWIRGWQTMASGLYLARCLILWGCELRMVFTILSGWEKKLKNNICDSRNHMKLKVQCL